MNKKIMALGIVVLLAVAAWVYAGQEEKEVSNGFVTWPQYYNGTSFRYPRLDAITRDTVTIDTFHSKIHSSDAYIISGTTILGSGVTNAFAFAVPSNSKYPHMTIQVLSSGALSVYLLEKCNPRDIMTNLASGGTIFNHDRNSTNTSGCTSGWIRQGSPPQAGAAVGNHSFITPGGTTVFDQRFSAAVSSPVIIGGQYQREAELILKSGTTYVLQFTSAAATNNISYVLNWYEHTALDN